MVERPTPAEREEQIKHTQIFSHGVISASSDLWLWDFLKHREFTYLLTLSVFSSVTLSRHFEHQPDPLSIGFLSSHGCLAGFRHPLQRLP